MIQERRSQTLSYNGATEKMMVSGFMNAIVPRSSLRFYMKKFPKLWRMFLRELKLTFEGRKPLATKKPENERDNHRSITPQPTKSLITNLLLNKGLAVLMNEQGVMIKEGLHDLKSVVIDTSKLSMFILRHLKKSSKEAKYSFWLPHPLSKAAIKWNPGTFCAFHNDTSHSTNHSFQLKKHI